MRQWLDEYLSLYKKYMIPLKSRIKEDEIDHLTYLEEGESSVIPKKESNLLQLLEEVIENQVIKSEWFDWLDIKTKEEISITTYTYEVMKVGGTIW